MKTKQLLTVGFIESGVSQEDVGDLCYSTINQDLETWLSKAEENRGRLTAWLRGLADHCEAGTDFFALSADAETTNETGERNEAN